MINTVKILYRILDKTSKKKFLLIVLLLFVSGGLSLLGIGAVIPFVTVLLSPEKNWLGNILADQKTNILPITILIMVAAFWLKNIISYYCVKTQTKILFGMAYKFSRELFHVYMRAPYSWHLSQSTPELIRNVINECYVIAGGILAPLGTFSTELVSSLFIFIFLLYINVKFTLIVSGALLLCMLFYGFLTRNKVRYYANKRTEAWASMTKDVMQGIGGIKESKIYELEQHFISSFDEQSNIAADSAAFSSIYSQAPRFALEAVAITVVMIAICLIWSFNRNNNEILLILSIFGVAAMQLLPSLNRLMTSFASIKYSSPALSIIEKALNTNIDESKIKMIHSDHSNYFSGFEKELHLDKISFSYPDGTCALNNVSLTIKKGQSVALVGYSGAGKTSLADIILGLFKLKSGKIYVDGVELGENNQRLWQQHLGYIPQFIYLYDCTIKENVAFGVSLEKIDEDQVWQALDIANLKEFVNSLPHGLNTQIGENGVRLSGGQRQRVGIARALFRNPGVLIMDEATAALDNQTEKEVTQSIQKAARNRTVITIAHRLSTVKNSDVIFVMEEGGIIASGSYNELINDCELFRDLIQVESIEYHDSRQNKVS